MLLYLKIVLYETQVMSFQGEFGTQMTLYHIAYVI